VHESSNFILADNLTYEPNMVSNNLQQLTDVHHQPCDLSIVEFDASASAGCAMPLPANPMQDPSLMQNRTTSLDPANWTSDDVKGLFNSKIGICPEQAYEKLKLCALGVICHWDNNLGKTDFIFRVKYRIWFTDIMFRSPVQSSTRYRRFQSA
jgi:hypothetical protein